MAIRHVEYFAVRALDSLAIYSRLVWTRWHGAAIISLLIRAPASRRCESLESEAVPGRTDPHRPAAPGPGQRHVRLVAWKSDENWCNSVHPAFAWPQPKCSEGFTACVTNARLGGLWRACLCASCRRDLSYSSGSNKKVANAPFSYCSS